MHTYGLRSRYDRLRQRGMLNRKEMADRLGIHEQTVERWAKHGILKAHSYNDNGWQLYEIPGPNLPAETLQSMGSIGGSSSRRAERISICCAGTERGVV